MQATNMGEGLSFETLASLRVCPSVQLSTQHGTWIPVGTLPGGNSGCTGFDTSCRRLLTILCPAFLVAVTYAQLVVVNWTFPCQSVHVRGAGVCLRRTVLSYRYSHLKCYNPETVQERR